MSVTAKGLLFFACFTLTACSDDPTGVIDAGDEITIGRYTLSDTTASSDTSAITEFSLDDWLLSEGDGTWRVEDGALVAEGMVAQMALLHEDVEVGQDSWIEVDVDHADDGGLVLRAQDEDSYYLVAIRDDATAVGASGADSNLELYRFVDGEWDSFADYGGADVDWPRGTLATIKVWAIEDVVLVFFNDVLVITGQDAAFDAGALGVRTNSFFHTQLVPSMVRYRALRWGTF